MDVSIALFIGFVIAYAIYRLTKLPDQFPPAPRWKIPFIGHLLSIGKDPLVGHTILRKEHGDIVGMQLGVLRSVTLYDHKLMKEAYSNVAFTGRPDLPIFNEATDGKYGIIASDGEAWEQQRRFSVRHLRDLGFAKKAMESLIQEEVVELLEGLSKEVGQSLNLKHRFGILALNSIWRLVTGERVPHTDPKLNSLLKTLHSAFQETAGGSVSLFVPLLSRMFPKLSGYQKFMDSSKAPFPFYEAQIVSHKQSFQDGESRDFMDDYLQEMKKTVDPKSSFYGEEGEKHFRAVTHDLFVAGSETTSLTLQWLILYVSTHPEVQERLYNDIIKTVGKSKLPTLDDRPNLPYAEAVINETLRRSSIVPFGVMHTAVVDTEFHGYKIPKDTGISGFHYGFHHDPKIWGDPNAFRPDRFLNEDGKFQGHEAMMAFSTGKRKCPGATFALDQLFLVTTSIFQRFRVRPDPDKPEPSLEPELMMFLVPKEYYVVMEERK